MTTDQWEKYVEPAADEMTGHQIGSGFYSLDVGSSDAREMARAALAVVGPLIAEDTRERMVAAAARAVDREARKPLIASDDPFAALQNVLALSSNDWGSAGDFAWLYGIILGWDTNEPGEESSMPSAAAKHGWSGQQVELLRSLHEEFTAAAKTYRCTKAAS